ncbi:homeobox protein HAT3.1 isoform X2 [Momordica charantia]|uniref:Homeobox protein HAT3.1 isoform X2 n=1 Tax=Momordica charantia TaxID=3673 RepID=A0A6J1D7M5_MOMCH|nr:homeobox protein HAT3.1 isoform X2 [Momordica charantia]
MGAMVQLSDGRWAGQNWRRAPALAPARNMCGGSGRQTVRVKAGRNAAACNGGPDLEDSETKPLYSLFALRTRTATTTTRRTIDKILLTPPTRSKTRFLFTNTSSDKLKPEKELQRASSEIMRGKLKIRDLFQHLDSLCAEGRLSESLFDSEGQIDSEDIFCAKCGSKELSLENDIILCDGICDRGFHQFCLEPPLLNTDIPPDDEGWLCPGCDCKDDCLDLLNEFQGSNLSITDGWEKVYPEAAAAAAGQNSDHALGLPSDDSEDGDYDPDAPDTINQEDESSSDQSSSDESGYASASEELEAAPNDDQYLGLPSDDSEDDDYEPGAPELDEGVKQESSGSDFTSDSEDLAALDDGTTPVRNSNGQGSGCGPRTSVLHNELQSLLESGPDKDGLEPVSGRRQVERLDYKKLHDETYGNVPSDSSDDTFGSISIDSSDDRGRGSRTRKRSPKNLVPALNGTNDDLKNKKTKRSYKRRTHQKPGAENMKNSVTRTPEDSVKSSSSVRRTASSSNRRLSQPALERLLASFQENQYPKRATKESLAQELGLSLKQVSKWFENTRWSTRHPSSIESNKAKSALRMGIQSSETSGKLPKPEQESGACFRDTDNNGAQHQVSPNTDGAVAPCQSGDTRDDKLATQKTTRPESTATKSRKRKGRSDHVASHSKDRKESQKPPAKSPKVNQIQTADKVRTRRRRSI